MIDQHISDDEKYNTGKFFLKTFSLPKGERIAKSINSFTPAERVLFWFFVALLVGSALVIFSRFNQLLLVEVPARGGHFSEGIIGSPRFINPLLALSDADRDLTALLYSGLMKATPDGKLIPDLAESFAISDDGLTYTFLLKDTALFHDGTPVTAGDVIFTVTRAQDPALKSPKRASWDGIIVEGISDRELRFILKQPYAPFLENATLGILPEHIWKDADVEQFPFSNFNIEPVGSGPYKIKRIKRNSSGVSEFYELKAYNKYALGRPFIETVTIMFYANEETLLEGFKGGAIEGVNSISAETLGVLNDTKLRIEHPPLPRIFAVFFNQNQAPVFAHKEVRRALAAALDKQNIVREVLGGYGATIDSPIPPGILATPSKSADILAMSEASTTEHARKILEEGGWTWDENESVWEKVVKKERRVLRFSLATSNAPELKRAAELIVEAWQRVGIAADLTIFETGDLNQNVIRPRTYDALFFGEIIGRELDLFAFWHSSQRNDPGLNIALYANIAADKLLEEARTLSDSDEREEKYKAFEKEIADDTPAIFIYAPDFIYVVPEKIQGLRLGSITTPSERFLNIHEWHIETDKVWNIFSK